MATLSERLRPRPVAVFVILTLLIWTNRIWLAWTNDEDTIGQKLVWSTPITLFVIASLYLLVQLLTGRRETALFAPIVRVFAGATIVYWAIRITIIATGDHPVGFKVVHAILAIASAAAAVWAWRSVGATAPVDGRSRDGTPVGAAR